MKKIIAIVAAFFATISLAFAQVNINSATKEQLDSLPGIGPVKAQAIVDYRAKNGNFKSLDDLKKVNGIGDKTFDGLKDKISLSGATKVEEKAAPAKKDAAPAAPAAKPAAAPAVAPAPAAKPVDTKAAAPAAPAAKPVDAKAAAPAKDAAPAAKPVDAKAAAPAAAKKDAAPAAPAAKAGDKPVKEDKKADKAAKDDKKADDKKAPAADAKK